MCIAKCILDILGTAIDIDVVVERVTCATVNKILPVVGRDVVIHIEILIVAEKVGIRRNLTGIVVVLQESKLILPCSIVSCTEHILLLGNLFPAIISIVAHLCLAFLTALGSHQDNTVSTTATIDGGRRSVLQHGDVLNVIGRNVTDTLNGETIDNVQRLVRLGDRTTATHTNLNFSIRRTFSCCNLHTNHLTRQGLRSVGNRYCLQGIATYRGHRTGEVLPLY